MTDMEWFAGSRRQTWSRDCEAAVIDEVFNASSQTGTDAPQPVTEYIQLFAYSSTLQGHPHQQPSFYSVGIAGGVGRFNPPSSFLQTPSLIYSFVLGGQKITPQIALVYSLCAIIALAQFLSRHCQRYSIDTA